MQRHKLGLFVAAAALLLAAAGRPVAAEVSEVRIARAVSIAFLPLMVMEHQKLLEKHARAAGLGEIKVSWVALTGGTAINDALLAGELSFASGGVTPFLTLWSRTQDNIKVKAVGAMCSMPLYLNTRNSNVRSIRDFTEKDRIAVLAVKSALQAIILQMAAARQWGDANYAKLDPITVSMPLPDALAALVGGRGEITADFTVKPFAYTEIETPGIRNILNSYDVLGGPTTFSVVYTTSKFHETNPRTVAALVAALNEAIALIQRDKKLASEIYVQVSKQKVIAESILRMLNDPDITFSAAPQNTMKYADFMHKVGTMKVKPATWRDLFFPGPVHKLAGS